METREGRVAAAGSSFFDEAMGALDGPLRARPAQAGVHAACFNSPPPCHNPDDRHHFDADNPSHHHSSGRGGNGAIVTLSIPPQHTLPSVHDHPAA